MYLAHQRKVSELIDYYLQPIMKKGNFYIKNTGDCLEKLRAIGEILKEFLLVTADVVELYPKISHNVRLKVLWKHYGKFIGKTVLFVLKNNFFEKNSKFYKQILKTAIGTKFFPPYACISWTTSKQSS